MTLINEDRIRELAHLLWESEGRPSGEAGRHWQMAYEIVSAEAEQGILPPTSVARRPAKNSRRLKDILETEFTSV